MFLTHTMRDTWMTVPPKHVCKQLADPVANNHVEMLRYVIIENAEIIWHLQWDGIRF